MEALATRRARLPIDDSLCFRLVRVVNLTARPFLESPARSHHLSRNAWRAMVVLAGRPGVAAREIAGHTGLDKTSISRASAALDRHGRIRKQGDAADARRNRPWLNAAGSALFKVIGTQAGQREAQLFGGISRAEQAALASTMDRLIAALQEPRAGAVLERCDGAPVHCERHRREQTTLYRLVQRHATTFFAESENTVCALRQAVHDRRQSRRLRASDGAAHWHRCSSALRPSASQRTAACRLNPLKSAHCS